MKARPAKKTGRPRATGPGAVRLRALAPGAETRLQEFLRFHDANAIHGRYDGLVATMTAGRAQLNRPNAGKLGILRRHGFTLTPEPGLGVVQAVLPLSASASPP